MRSMDDTRCFLTFCRPLRALCVTSGSRQETAMGSAIECFDDAGAVVVPRSRFAPVKTCNDLFALRSDAYRVTEESTIVLASAQPPLVKLDDRHYKCVGREGELGAGEMRRMVLHPPDLGLIHYLRVPRLRPVGGPALEYRTNIHPY